MSPRRSLRQSFAARLRTSLVLLALSASPLLAQRTVVPDTAAAKPTAKPPVKSTVAAAPKPSPREPALRKQELRADDGHILVFWEKRPASKPKGEILLLHGRTWSALPNFDLHAPGQNVSLMNALVAEGYTVFALDQRGYGATGRDASGWLTPNRAADDVAALTDWVAAHSPAFRRPTVLGYSRGSATAMLAAQKYPKRMAGLIMYGPYYSITKRPEAVEDPRVPPRARTSDTAAAEDFITPDSTPAGVKAAYVKAATSSDPVRVDWRREGQFDVLNPAAVRIPTLLIHGERDPYSAEADLPAFFAKLGTMDKWWVVLAGADHVAHLERQSAFVHALTSFMERGR